MKIEMISKAVICVTSPLMYSGKPGVKFREAYHLVTRLLHIDNISHFSLPDNILSVPRRINGYSSLQVTPRPITTLIGWVVNCTLSWLLFLPKTPLVAYDFYSLVKSKD